ncbi:hypothetical protein GmHk_13G036229 [Glycine max]|nr:hypothetical protein GmHk_13G036229 [Glycine max]
MSQQLSETEWNMWAIIDECKEKLNLAANHEQRLEDEYAKISTEREARERVIDSLHQEATMGMDRFALTLNRSQELPRLLAKAKAVADTYSAHEEIHGLLSYSYIPNEDVNNSTPILIKSQQPQSDHAHVSRPMEETHEIPHHDLADFEPCLGYATEGQAVGDVTSLKELGRLMGPLQRQAFRKVYEKILDLAAAEVFTEAVVSLAQYYDQPLRCFTFGDFQMVPTIEEFEEILGCPLGGRKTYLFSDFLPSLSKIAAVIGDSTKELDRMKQTRNGVVGLPQKYLEGKARDMASQEMWSPFADILALLIFGVVLFPNVDGLVDLATIDAFLAYHHSKESPVVAILANLFDTFDRRCEKNSARIVCCLPALCVWLISHLFQQDTRHSCPLQSYRSCAEKGRADWDQHLAEIGGSTINWFPRWKEGKEGVLFSCGDYPNVPLIGTSGCINYNPVLAIRQLGYPMRGAPTEGSLSPFLVKDLGAQGLKVIQRIHKAWRSPLKKDKELRGIRNGVIGGYHGWLRIHARGLDWLSKLKVIDEENFKALEEDEEVRALKLELGKARLAKEKFKSAASHIQKEYTELQEENAATARALEQETKRARKEEYGREKFRGALWGSNNELKLRREERDRSRVHGMILKEALVACARSKRSLAQHLEATKQSMLAIIGQYKEELNQSMAHEQKLVEDFAQVYAEKEARGRVIDALHQEATMWMDRFALTLNGSQDLPRLLAKAKAMAEVCTAPEEIHGLINYCQHMIDLMAHIIRNQVMLKLQKTIEDKATATASSTVREAEPVLQPALNPSLDRNTAVFGRRYSLQAYPYGLPPDFTPRATPEDLSQAPIFEGQLPPYEDYPGQDNEEGDTHLSPLLHLKDPSPHELPEPNIVCHIPTSPTPVKESVPFVEDKGKIEFEYDANMAPNNNRRAPEVGARKKEGHAHAVTTAPTWMKAPQNIQSSYQPNPPNFLMRAGNSLPTQVKGPPVQERAPAQRTAPAAPRPVNNTAPDATYKYAQHPPPKDNFPPIPMAYSENGFEPGMGLGKDCLGNADVVDIKGNPYKYVLGYESGMPGRRNVLSRFRADRVWPGRISQCFTSAGMVSEEEVATIEEEFPQDPPSFVQPCHPDSQPSLKKRFYQVKIKSLEVTSLRELGQLMGQLQWQAFRKAYGKIWDLARVEVSMEPIASLSQYYDQPLRCFTFEDFQLVPTVKEFEEILGCPLGGRKPYLFSGFYPSTTRVAKVVKISAQELDRVKQNRNGVVGVPRKCLEERAKALANQGEWAFFIDILALLIFGVVLFPNMEGLVDLAAIDAFLAFHHGKESPVVAILAMYDTFDRGCEKSSARIVCCALALYVWLVGPSIRYKVTARASKKERRIGTNSWLAWRGEGRIRILSSCEGCPNVPLMGTRGCINYNPVLAIRQLGYPMRGVPSDEGITPFITTGFQ